MPPPPEVWWDEEMLSALDDDPGAGSLCAQGGPEGGRGEHTALPPRVEAWRRRSAGGAIVTGVVRGLAEVFQPWRDEVAIVAEVPGAPPGPPGPLTVHLDEDDPTASSVVIRPWLMDGADSDDHGDDG